MTRVERHLSATQWIALKAAWGGRAYFGSADKSLLRDCVLAISLGGRYTLDKVAPACRSVDQSRARGWA